MLDVRRSSRLVDYWAVRYLRTWRGGLFSGFGTPLLMVLGMGVLLGGFVKVDPSELEGAHSYLEFFVPGMLASQVMTTVFSEMTYPVMGALKWNKTYYAQIATPLTVADVALAQVGFVLFRCLLVATTFVAVLAPFGVFSGVGGALGALLVQLLVAAAFATPLYALSAGLETDGAFSVVFRLGMTPMFLFSGAFFPISRLPDNVRWLAQLTPLWHGVDLTRMLTLGTFDLGPALLHVAYLSALGYLGWVFAVRRLQRRLST